jgi:hypothetical protein
MGAPDAHTTGEGSSSGVLVPPTVTAPDALAKTTALSVTPACTPALTLVYGGRGALAGHAGGMTCAVHAPRVGAGVGDKFGQPHVVAGMTVVLLHTPMPLLLPLKTVGITLPSEQYHGPIKCRPE